MTPSHQIFLLSPANSAGKRAALLLQKDGRSALAQRLRAAQGGTGGGGARAAAALEEVGLGDLGAEALGEDGGEGGRRSARSTPS